MSARLFWSWVKRWWVVAGMLFALGWDTAILRGELDAKASRSSVEEINRKMDEILRKIEDMDQRQRSYFCDGKPSWCR